MPDTPPVRVLFVQLAVPSYRLPLFSRLATSPRLKIVLACGDPLPQAGQRSIRDVPGTEVLHLTNWYFFNSTRLVYQKGWLRAFSRPTDVIVAEFNPRIITTLSLMVAAKLTGRCFIWWGHGIGPMSETRRWIMRFRLALARLADATIFYDDAQLMRFVEAGLDPNKTYVAQNTIDVDRAKRFVELRRRSDRTSIVCLGRLMERKKVGLLLTAFAMAQADFKSKQVLTIVGDGPDREDLEERAIQLGIAHVTRFTGAVDDEEALARHLNDAWASVSPGAAGLNLVHSAVYGIPLLLSRHDPHGPEVSLAREGVNALYFCTDDASDLAGRLLALERNDELWERLSEGAAKSVTTGYGMQAMVRTFEKAITNAAQRRLLRHT